MKRLFSIVLLSLCLSVPALAGVTVYEFDSPQQEAQYQALIEDFRCPTCQNQNLAGSDAIISQDLKRKVYEMVKDGKTDQEIRAYMSERYGDFIHYKPPVRPSTWILWYFPPILLVVLVIGWLIKNRKKKKTTASTATPLSASEEAQLTALLNTHKAQKHTDNKEPQ